MARFLGGRLLSLIPVLFGASVFAFALGHLAPGSITSVLLGPYASAAARHALSQQLGLNEPLPVQYLRWLVRAVQGNLGDSIQLQAPVVTVILTKFQNTLLLGSISFIVALIVGLGVGFVSGVTAGGTLDRCVQGATALFAYVPVFFMGVLLVYIFAVRLKVLPSGGMGPAAGGGSLAVRAKYFVLPVITTAGIPAAIISKATRNAVRTQAAADYVRSAESQGLRQRTVRGRYIMRGALPSIIHVSGLQLAYLLTGSLIFTEVVFTWPGLGYEVYSAVTSHDIPVIQGVVLLSAIVFVVVNFAADALHAAVDPRAREPTRGFST